MLKALSGGCASVRHRKSLVAGEQKMDLNNKWQQNCTERWRLRTRNYLQTEGICRHRNMKEKKHSEENNFENILENIRMDKVELSVVKSRFLL